MHSRPARSSAPRRTPLPAPRCRPGGARPSCAPTSRWSTRPRRRSRSCARPGCRRPRSTRRWRSPRTSRSTRSSACRSTLPTTCAPTWTRKWSTACSPRSWSTSRSSPSRSRASSRSRATSLAPRSAASRPIRTSRCIRASPASSRSTTPGTRTGPSRSRRAERRHPRAPTLTIGRRPPPPTERRPLPFLAHDARVSATMNQSLRAIVSLRSLIFVCSAIMFAVLVHYFFTGAGGPRLLATRLVPLALIVHMLIVTQQDWLYPRLPAGVNYALLTLYVGICLYAIGYFYVEYENIAIWRQGSYNRHDFIVGLLVFLLVMELSRLAHPILFWVNVVMIFYTLFGYLSPIDFFWHPG